MGGKPPRPPPPFPTADELEQRRRLALIGRNQQGRGATLLSKATSVDSVVNQTLLGQTR